MKQSAILLLNATAALAGYIERRQNTTACSPLELLIARGTTEPLNPSYGVIVGDPLFLATKALIPDVTGYEVNYPASFDCNSRDLGTNDTVNHLNTQSLACPQQQYALVGYSQGADVMHFAAQSIPEALFPRIVALALYGDPGNRGPGQIDPLGGTTPVLPSALAAKLIELCAFNDPVCNNNGTVVDAHLSYSNPNTTYISDGANYIAKEFQSGGTSGPVPAVPGPGDQTPENIQALSSLGAILGSSTGMAPCSTAAPTSMPSATQPAVNIASVTSVPEVVSSNSARRRM